jgi:hypothetical protein
MLNIQEYIPLYSVFILILILSGGFIIELIPCKLQKILKNNVYIKHFFCFLTLIFLITIVDSTKDNIKLSVIIQRSILLYIFFILIIKTNYIFFIAIMIILSIKYLIYLYQKQYDEFDKNTNIEKKHNDLDDIIVMIQNILFGVVILLLIIGVLVYYGQKKYEFKNNFSIMTFLFGKSDCSFTNSNISAYKSFKYAFT